MSATPNVVQLSPRQTSKGRHRSKGKPPSDPIIAAIADHRRLLSEYCAAQRDMEEVSQVEAQTPFFERQLAALVAERDRLEKAEHRALSALSRIKPSTPAGAAALIAYVCKDMKEVSGEDWHLSALANVAQSLAAMRVRT
jgi:hypothetical protein